MLFRELLQRHLRVRERGQEQRLFCRPLRMQERFPLLCL